MKIEAGKYYKTRDGDKVGPMIRFPDADWSGRAPHWSTDDRGEFWGRDGTNGKPDGGLAGNDRNLDLIAEWTDGPVFTVGAKVRRIAYPHPFVPIGYEATVTAINGDNLFYVDADGDPMNSSVEYWELVSEAPTGPVRTVTRREVVPGVYSYVSVMEKGRGEGSAVAHVAIVPHHFSADELKAAAAVLLELAGALDSE